jgi:surface protein
VDRRAGQRVTSPGQLRFQSPGHLQQAVTDYLCPDSDGKTAVAEVFGTPIGVWCVANIADFSDLFAFQSDFNEDISNWDVSSATNMQGMFFDALIFNQDLSKGVCIECARYAQNVRWCHLIQPRYLQLGRLTCDKYARNVLLCLQIQQRCLQLGSVECDRSGLHVLSGLRLQSESLRLGSQA